MSSKIQKGDLVEVETLFIIRDIKPGLILVSEPDKLDVAYKIVPKDGQWQFDRFTYEHTLDFESNPNKHLIDYSIVNTQ